MAKKPTVEADLDPPGHTRPGSKAAETALANSRPGSNRRTGSSSTAKKSGALEADLDPRGTRHTRPGGSAAARAVDAAKGKSKRKTGR